jgi:hypothetical protein
MIKPFEIYSLTRRIRDRMIFVQALHPFCGRGGSFFCYSPPMSPKRAKYCLQMADECEDRAKKASDDADAQVLLKVAEQWRELAAQIDRWSLPE